MKKLFTLLFTFGSLTSVFAQYNNENRPRRDDDNTTYESRNGKGGYSNPATDRNNDKRDNAYNDRRYNESYAMNSRERDFQIQKINRQFSYKISSVRGNRYLRAREKDFQIRNLERQRQDEIRNIENRYRGSRNRYYDSHANRW